jgi:rhodanese-related sulfurtransferase
VTTTATAERSRIVGVADAKRLLSGDNSLVVDVRTPAEFATSHIPDAVNIPVDQLDPHLRRIVNAAGGTLVLVCQSGGRAEQAADKLVEGGHDDLVVLSGGMGAWEAAGQPTDSIEGEEKWALERQVRLVAGSIVLGSVLASARLPRAKWLAAGIGGGLTFAALSNSCLMGTLLSKLPYNQGPGCDIDAAVARLGAEAEAA